MEKKHCTFCIMGQQLNKVEQMKVIKLGRVNNLSINVQFEFILLNPKPNDLTKIRL